MEQATGEDLAPISATTGQTANPDKPKEEAYSGIRVTDEDRDIGSGLYWSSTKALLRLNAGSIKGIRVTDEDRDIGSGRYWSATKALLRLNAGSIKGIRVIDEDRDIGSVSVSKQ